MGMGWVLGDFVVFGWDPVEISLSIRFEGKSRVYEDENNTIEQPDACSMDAISRGDFAWVWVGCSENLLFLVGIPVEISLSIRFEGKSRVYEDENNTIEQPDACSMDAISRGDFAWVWVGCSEILLFLVGIPWRFRFQSALRASLGSMRMKTIPQNSRMHAAWTRFHVETSRRYGLGARRICCFWLGSRGDFAFNPL